MASPTSLLVTQLYVGYYNRAPDPSGLEYWVGRYNQGMSLVEIANSFAVQVESTNNYHWLATPNLDAGLTQFIETVYQNLFERAPDVAGLAYWRGELLTGKPAGRFILDVISGAQGDDAEIILRKTEVANHYADQVVERKVDWTVEDDRAGAVEALAGDRQFWLSSDAVSKAKTDVKEIIDTDLGATVGVQSGDQISASSSASSTTTSAGSQSAGSSSTRTQTQNTNQSTDTQSNGQSGSEDKEPGQSVGNQQNVLPPPAMKFLALTTGIDNVTVHANETVLGNDLTWNPGDRITGASGTVDINYGNAAGPFFGTINNVDLVNLTTTGPTVQVATNWTNIDQITVKQSTGALVLQDLQASSNDAPPGQTFTNYAVRDYQTANTVTFNFDKQAVDGTNTIVNLGVSEVSGGILLNVNGFPAESIETVNMTILDTPAFTSKIASFSAQNIQTLNIDGGAAGLAFEIVAPLDAGLKTINASKAASNLTLDVSNSTEAMSITMGSGDDYLKTGDTLSPLVGPGADTLIGGPGTDTVEAIFTTAGTRQPIMSGFEIANVTFNNNATWNFSDTNDLHTINVASSTHRIALHDMDSTVSTINVTGLQAPGAPGGPGTARHDFWWVDGKAVTMNWTSKVAEDPDAGELYFRDIQTVTFNHSGPFDTRFIDSIPDGDDSVFQFDDSLLNLTINNKGTGDMYLLGGDGDETIAATRMMQTLSINATGGDIAISGDVDTILNLRQLTLTAMGGNYLALDDIGTPDDDINGGTGIGERLELVTVQTGSNSVISMDELRADKSTISTFTIIAGNDSDITIEDIHAQDISEMNITLAEESTMSFDGGSDIFLVNQGDNLVVTGAGLLNPLDFDTEAFAVMNFSGLTVNGVDVDWSNAAAGSKVTGTKFADTFDGGNGADNIDSGLGNDDVDGNGGNDVLTDAGGNNHLEGGLGVDTINLTLGKGIDLVHVGFRGPTNVDTVNGFDTLQDVLHLDLGQIETKTGNPAPDVDDVVRGDGKAVSAADAATFQTVGVGGAEMHFDANVFNIIGTKFGSVAELQAAIQIDGSHELSTNFFFGPAGNNDAFMINWQDNAGNGHVSAAIVTQSHLDGGEWTYNFQVQDMVSLTGVPVINQTNVDFV